MFNNIGVFILFSINPKIEHYAHSLRVPFYSSLVFESLGVQDEKFFSDLVVSQMIHDIGKLAYNDIVDKNKGFSKKDLKRMKNHVEVSMHLTKKFFRMPRIVEYVGSHHLYQPNSYPAWLLKKFQRYKIINSIFPFAKKINNVEEKILVGIVTGMIDYHDAAATRANERNKHMLKTPDKLREELKEQFLNIIIKYDSGLFDKIDCSGPKLIDRFFNEEIFGREEPINPFKIPYSFLKQ